MHSLQSSVTPGDFVGSVLGYQGAGINNSENVGRAMFEGTKSFFRLFGFGDLSPHSYYPCTAGCGNEGFMPEKGNYYNPSAPDGTKQSPMTQYYKENFEVTRSDGARVMTIDTSLLPINNNKNSSSVVDLRHANSKEDK